MFGVPGHELPLRAEFPLCAPWRLRRATRAGGGVAAGASSRMATPGQRGSHVRGSVDSARASAPCGLSASRGAGAGSPFRRRRALCVSWGPPGRNARGIPDPRPHSCRSLAPAVLFTPTLSVHHPGAPDPPPRAPRRSHPRMPAGLPESLVHYLRLWLVPERRGAPLQDAAGRREHLRHAGRSSGPARPAAQPRGGAAARPAAPRTRGAAYGHSPVTRILAPPHLPAAALRPAPSGFPLSRRLRPPRCPGFPSPGPGPPACASRVCPPSSHSRPVSSSPRPFAASRGPKSHPCRGFPLGPCASWKSRGGSGTREGTRSPTHEKGRWGPRGQGDAAQPLGSFERSRGAQAEKHKWVAWTRREVFPGPISAFSCAPGAPPFPSAGVSFSGLSLGRSVAQAPFSFPDPRLPCPLGAGQEPAASFAGSQWPP